MSKPEFFLSRAAVRELDRRSMDEFSVPGVVLMENAGRGVAKLMRALNPQKHPVLILCGPGNNGGDGFVIARHLDYHGWPVTLLPFEQEGVEETGATRTVASLAEQLPAAAKTNFEIVRLAQIGNLGAKSATAEIVRQAIEQAGENAWIVDSLFGTGLSRPIQSPIDEVIKLVNASKLSVLAVDLPSGLDADSGEPLGPTIRAQHTATFVAPKLGFVNPKSREWTGEIHVVEIGAPRVLVEQYRDLYLSKNSSSRK